MNWLAAFNQRKAMEAQLQAQAMNQYAGNLPVGIQAPMSGPQPGYGVVAPEAMQVPAGSPGYGVLAQGQNTAANSAAASGAPGVPWMALLSMAAQMANRNSGGEQQAPQLPHNPAMSQQRPFIPFAAMAKGEATMQRRRKKSFLGG